MSTHLITRAELAAALAGPHPASRSSNELDEAARAGKQR